MERINTHPLEISETVKVGNSVYVIERHFENGRTLRDAVYEIVKNEAKRESDGQNFSKNLNEFC